MRKQLWECDFCGAEKTSLYNNMPVGWGNLDISGRHGNGTINLIYKSCGEKHAEFRRNMREAPEGVPVEIATTDEIAQKLKDGIRLEVAGIFDENGRLLQLTLMDIPAKRQIGWCREGYRYREFTYFEPKDMTGWYPVYTDG